MHLQAIHFHCAPSTVHNMKFMNDWMSIFSVFFERFEWISFDIFVVVLGFKNGEKWNYFFTWIHPNWNHMKKKNADNQQFNHFSTGIQKSLGSFLFLYYFSSLLLCVPFNNNNETICVLHVHLLFLRFREMEIGLRQKKIKYCGQFVSAMLFAYLHCALSDAYIWMLNQFISCRRRVIFFFSRYLGTLWCVKFFWLSLSFG